MIALRMQLERLERAAACLSDLQTMPNEIEDSVIAAKASMAIKQIELVTKFITNFNTAVNQPEVVDEALDLIADERRRQQKDEGYSTVHDDKHKDGEMALLAAAYAIPAHLLNRKINKSLRNAQVSILESLEDFWGGDWEDFFKPKSPIRDLVRAGALILAELERVIRAENEKETAQNT